MDLINRYKKLLQPASRVLSDALRATPIGPGIQFLQSPQGKQVVQGVQNTVVPQIQRSAQAYGELRMPAVRPKNYTPQRAASNVFEVGKGAAMIAGAPRVGAGTLLSSSLLGGGINKLAGGNFFEGAGQGIAASPMLAGVGSLTNPLVAKYAAKLVPKGSGELSRFVANRTATGALNVPEGAIMSASLGHDPLSLGGAALDFGVGFATGSTVSRGGKARTLIKGNATNQYKYFDPQDKRELAGILEDMVMKIDDPNYRINRRDNDEQILRGFAEKYINKKFAREQPLQNIAQELTNRLRSEDEAADITLPEFPAFAAQNQKKYAFNINKERLDLSTAGKQALDEAVETFRPELEAARGKPLSHKEVVEAAETAEVLQRSVSREATLKAEAALLRTRQAVAAGANGEGLTRDFVDNMRILSSYAADAGRKLGSFRIQAAGVEASAKEQVIRQLTKLGHDTEALVKQAEGVDWNDNRQVLEYYRKFVKPTLGEMLNEYRYFNLLSSPKTQIVNIFSNAIQAGIVRPSTKLASGLIDPIASALTGSARENYVREVPVYYRGMFAAIPGALQKVRDVYTGKAAMTNLDFDRLPSNTLLSKGNIVTKTMEGMDQFFRTIIEGGEKEAFRYKFGRAGREVSDMEVEKLAQQAGQYSTFRQGLHTEGQGPVLDWFDKGTDLIMRARRIQGISWFVPFVQTPMNILKQGFEYSPAGFTTLAGADNKREQVAKALVGSSVFLGAGYLAMQDRLTWAVPKDKAQRDAFYAAGMQPYSIKIGNRWHSFAKLGPLAYPLALAAGIKYAYQDDPNAVANSDSDKAIAALSGAVGFFADQSYLQGIGDLLKAVEGREGFDPSRVVGNIATQYVPASSALRWATQIIDPIYRKGEGVMGNIAKGLPILSESQPYYEDPLGEPSERQFPIGNAFSPISVTEERSDFKALYNQRSDELEMNAILRKEERDLQKALQEPASANQAEAAGPTEGDPLAAKRAELNEKMAKKRVQIRGGVEETPNFVYYEAPDGSTKTIRKNRDITPPELTGQAELDKELISTWKSSLSSKVNDVRELYKVGKLSAEEAEQQIAELEAMKKAKAAGGASKKGKRKKVTPVYLKVPKAKKVSVIKPKRTRVKRYKLQPVKLSKVKKLSA